MLTRFRTWMAAALMAVAACAGQAAASEIVLRSELTGGFVRMQGGVLHANGTARQATRFEIIQLENRRVAFRAADGTFLRAGVGPETLLATGSPHIRAWETFELMTTRQGTSLRSSQANRLVEIDRRTGRMSATGWSVGPNTFISIVSAEPDRAPPPRPRVEWSGRWGDVWITGPNRRLQQAPAGSRVRFTISPRLEVEMTAGCNTKNARLSIEGQQARFSHIMTTKAYCNNPSGRFENAVSDAFQQVRSWEYREGQIAFLDGRGRTVLQIGR